MATPSRTPSAASWPASIQGRSRSACWSWIQTVQEVTTHARRSMARRFAVRPITSVAERRSIVSAWATANRVVAGPGRRRGKPTRSPRSRNFSTAGRRGAGEAVDAMGCKGGDYRPIRGWGGLPIGVKGKPADAVQEQVEEAIRRGVGTGYRRLIEDHLAVEKTLAATKQDIRHLSETRVVDPLGLWRDLSGGDRDLGRGAWGRQSMETRYYIHRPTRSPPVSSPGAAGPLGHREQPALVDGKGFREEGGNAACVVTMRPT